MRLPIDLVLVALLQLASAPDVSTDPSHRATPAFAASTAPSESAPAAPDQAEARPEPGPWSGDFTLGLDWFTGNSRVFTLTGDALAEYYSKRWILTVEADGEYEIAGAPGEEETAVAAEFNGWARGERRVTPVFSGYLFLGTATNRFASLQARYEVEAGLGITVLERRPGADDELLLRFYLGAHYSRDERFQYYPAHEEVPDQDVWSPGIGASLRVGFNDHLKLREDAFLYPAPTRVLVKSDTKLTAVLTGHLALSALFKITSNSEPAPGKATTDTTLELGLTLLF